MILKIEYGKNRTILAEVTEVDVRRHNFKITDKAGIKRLHETYRGYTFLLSNQFLEIVDGTKEYKEGVVDYLDYFLISYWQKGNKLDIVINGKLYFMENGRTSDKMESFRIEW